MVVNSLLFNVLMFDIDNFAGKFPPKNSLSIAHSIDDFLMPHCLTRFITNVETFQSEDFCNQILVQKSETQNLVWTRPHVHMPKGMPIVILFFTMYKVVRRYCPNYNSHYGDGAPAMFTS